RKAAAPLSVRRRPLLGAVLAGGTAVGLAALGVFPAARRAYSDGYSIYDRCPSYADDHNCSPGCGPSTIYPDSCEIDGANLGFHKDDGSTWTLRPNQCFSGSYDGWLWLYNGACGACACYVERRCHDGYRRTSSGFVKSICRWNTRCGCPGTVSWPTVRRGATGSDVYAVQHLLTHHGFATTPDGIFGPNTEAKVIEFQTGVGLTGSGIVGSSTWERLIVPVASGARGQAVTAAQRLLNATGYKLTLDGIFGANTDAATRDFQRQNGITVTGTIAVVTWRTLTGGPGIP
ncbi:MAG TPA: peptidoglycan-binding protein, partial [Pseudonocardiaceae bacterium]